MDISEQYIEMSKEAEEIQLLRREEKHKDTGKWVDGDFYADIADHTSMAHPSYPDAWADEPYYLHHPIEAIWLPRQDQLQEMLMNPPNTLCPDILTMLRLFNTFASVNPQFTSMEQLWLGFVMKEKYEKVWDGERWKK